MAYFRCGGGGHDVYIDYEDYDGNNDVYLNTINTSLYKFYKDLPDYNNSRILVQGANGALHALGGTVHSRSHYIYNNKTGNWDTGAELPGDLHSAYGTKHGDVIYMGGKLYAFGCNNYEAEQENLAYRQLYVENNSHTAWEARADLPYAGTGCAFVGDNFSYEIHMLGGINSATYRNHYKYNCRTKTWTEVSILPYGFVHGSAVYLNDEIHIFGSSYNIKGAMSLNSLKHYKYNLKNGGDWVKVSELPYDFCNGKAMVIGGKEIHILGGKHGENNVYNGTRHYKYDDKTGDWVNVGDIPFVLDGCGACITNEDEIILTANISQSQSKCYSLLCYPAYTKF